MTRRSRTMSGTRMIVELRYLRERWRFLASTNFCCGLLSNARAHIGRYWRPRSNIFFSYYRVSRIKFVCHFTPRPLEKIQFLFENQLKYHLELVLENQLGRIHSLQYSV